MPDGELRKPDFLDIEQVSAEIRERVARRTDRMPAAAPAPAVGHGPAVGRDTGVAPGRGPISLRLTASDELWSQVTGELLIGRMPASPPTVRGRVGRQIVALVRRSLFWLTSQIQAFQRAIAVAVKEQSDALRELARRMSEMDAVSGRMDWQADALAAEIRAREQLAIRTDAITESLHALGARFGTVESRFEDLRTGTERQAAGVAAEIHAREQIAFRTDAIAESLHALASRFGAVESGFEELRAGTERQAAGLQAEIRAREEVTFKSQAIGETLNAVNIRLRLLETSLEELRTAAQRHSAEIVAEIRAREEVAFRTDAIAEGLRDLDQRLKVSGDLALRIRQLEEYNHSTRAELLLQHQRLTALAGLERGAKSLPALPSGEGEAGLQCSYIEFQNIFRGTYPDIKNRFTVYLDRLKASGLDRPEFPLVDFGCGRGEWLSLLREIKVVAYGVDSDPGMVKACLQDGLVVQKDDLLPHLRSLPAESRGGVTAFHVIEHLPPPVLEEFLNECLRVLKPDGLLILETPNPRNVFVGSCTFYLDPTHCKPLPSELMRYLVHARGFTAIEILPLHPYPENARLNLPDNRAAEFIDEFFFGPQDYAVICRKPGNQDNAPREAAKRLKDKD